MQTILALITDLGVQRVDASCIARSLGDSERPFLNSYR